MGPEPRSRADQGQPGANPPGEEPRARPEPKVKSLEIDKRLIYSGPVPADSQTRTFWSVAEDCGRRPMFGSRPPADGIGHQRGITARSGCLRPVCADGMAESPPVCSLLVRG
jgi:hypothetical protein